MSPEMLLTAIETMRQGRPVPDEAWNAILDAAETHVHRQSAQITHVVDQCWRWHLECAVARVRDLEARLEELTSEVGGRAVGDGPRRVGERRPPS